MPFMISQTVLLAIVLAPLLAAIVAGLAGKVVGRSGAHTVTIAGVALSFALSAYVLKQLLDGAPTFDGEPPGWVVKPPASSHVPTVAGGRMLIVYLLPSGAIEFAPSA